MPVLFRLASEGGRRVRRALVVSPNDTTSMFRLMLLLLILLLIPPAAARAAGAATAASAVGTLSIIHYSQRSQASFFLSFTHSKINVAERKWRRCERR